MTTYYLSPTGNDANDGSLMSPWATIQHASGPYPAGPGAMSPGDTLLFRGGVYQTTYAYPFPGGLSPSQRTIFKAYPGERPVITWNINFQTPMHILYSYTEIDGLWFGGNAQDSLRAAVLDGFGVAGLGETQYKSVKNCVFWNYPYFAAGHTDFTLIQNCKFWGCGSLSPPSPADFTAAAYFRGKDGTIGAGDAGNHVLIDSCIFLNNAHDLFINLGRVFNSAIVTRNFLGNGPLGVYDLGNGALFANNIFWKGVSGGTLALDPKCSFARMWNNIFDKSAVAIYNEVGLVDQIARNNAFDPNVTTIGYPANSDVHYDSGGVIPLSKTRAQIDSAIAAIAASFAADVSVVATDATLDTNFALLAGLQAISGGAFNNVGYRWNNAQPAVVDIGLNVNVPASEDDFWTAFYALGLPGYDDNGLATYYTYPPVSIPPEPINW